MVSSPGRATSLLYLGAELRGGDDLPLACKRNVHRHPDGNGYSLAPSGGETRRCRAHSLRAHGARARREVCAFRGSPVPRWRCHAYRSALYVRPKTELTPDHVFGRGWGIWALWISIGLIAYVYSLSRSTTYVCEYELGATLERSPEDGLSGVMLTDRCVLCDFGVWAAHGHRHYRRH